ncbi:excinuclease ABC subunit UvrC [Propionicimonas sp.]|uniref:excinuclease ABC subunit UvrC n=1 Tax=Propionicimonas sp. TaxID=1955623 RepID=UPI0017FCCAF4|nr:excinuclease ABC subunit UvrC [Propionicimonas sp.]MBU3977608.1 excinuclease ABC subunit UvrC [Actinomycetota bacterium]MBA3021533.1 excinuclease ABC subunit UvrC [Propionicimonas sp.]MBU3987082.1 excinuclease ABC subunit UvrC [Actinomycetota bacterium]MBU4008903.1 excinuclease ABC subunit UvrC [Actinomycetota bacterium]MBU4065947.1 excinuclease ABC subunit UvrC [Actinomycetota bacterium]
MADPASYRPAPGTIPTGPGVYRFSDAEGRVVYVGKAINLRQRLSSYFADPAALHFRTQTMVRTAAAVDWTLVRNELEALQLEYTWIKQYDPRFNIKYRDDKSYPWVAVTWGEEFPRVYVGRGPKRKQNRYYGPYAQAWAIRQTLDSLLRVFPMRSCTQGVFNSAKSSGRPCLLGYIGKCAAPCVGRVNAEDHRELVEGVCEFLAGRTAGLIKRLETEMFVASAKQEFERAGGLRDQLGALKQASEQNAIVLGDGTDADVVALATDPLEVAIQVFHVRDGRIRGERAWVAERSDDADEGELLEQFLLQLYGDTAQSVPPLVLLPRLPATGEVLSQLLTEERGTKVRLRVPKRGDKAALLETAGRNAADVLALHKLRRSSDLSTRSRALEELQVALDLPQAPLRIECYDISHTQGTEVVASMVVFEDGLARKSEYRRFVIRTVEGSNDVGAMREVITRRFRRLLEERADDEKTDGPLLIDPTTGAPRKFAYLPALVVVDGGAPQVTAAARAMADLGITDVALCGLAKRLEEVWLPTQEYPLILPRASEALYLLQRVRDEAHRFAITHHRGRRSAAMLDSVLDDVAGLGELRRKALLKYFGSLRKLRKATIAELAEVPGIGPATAAAIFAALAAQEPELGVNLATGEVIQD